MLPVLDRIEALKDHRHIEHLCAACRNGFGCASLTLRLSL